ncbi:hypothetical protein BDF20DRAFT_901785 [Mycotypha africana]|uniref:uncharacterized protein n=1 Tax=Mycotypha africana TaxID=64632 RepID=UPI0023003BB2|nr:uncharacterized protein BDF20DRAFT_901785 [Mycotypha africana]KAI8967315.1 hypothetical protein BDF20DRAFT_901785 [Mycotypha africana]
MPINNRIATWIFIVIILLSTITVLMRYKSDITEGNNIYTKDCQQQNHSQTESVFRIRTSHSFLFEGIQNLALSMRDIPYSYLILLLVISVFCVPPLVGVAFLTTLSGFVYGFPFGGIPATLGTFFGSLYCYFIFSGHYDHYFCLSSSSPGRFLKLSKQQQEKCHLIQRAFKEGGFGMVLLIRLCPFPAQLQNLVLSLLCRKPEQTQHDEHVSSIGNGDNDDDTVFAVNGHRLYDDRSVMDSKTYIVTAFIGSFRFNIEVWIGSQLATLLDDDLPPEAKRVSLLVTAMGVCGFVAVAVWLYRLMIRLVKEKEEIAVRHDLERQEAEIGLLE